MLPCTPSVKSRAGRPRRLAPLPSPSPRNNETGNQRRPPAYPRPVGAAPGLAQSIQIYDVLRLPGESDGRATQRLRALLRLGEDQHRAFAGSGGVARYEASQVSAPALPSDDRHLRGVRALARYTAVLKDLRPDHRRLVENLVERLVCATTEQVLALIQSNKVAFCQALDSVAGILSHQHQARQGAKRG